MPSEELWYKALLIRRFEERLLELFREGHLHGTVHTSVGQEWSAIGVAESLQDGDLVFSNHRGHGHFIARGGDPAELLAEIMGRHNGLCAGIGGSQHLFDTDFISNGIQGGLVPVAAGTALARKMKGDSSIVAAFIGDGTLGQGILYEAMNIASKWQLPLAIIVENNQIAQTTPSSQTVAGTVQSRAQAFDIKYETSTTRLPDELIERLASALGDVRRRGQPLVFEVKADRLMPHSKSDDTRDPELLQKLRSQDVLTTRLEAGELDEMDQTVKRRLDEIVDRAMGAECIGAEALPSPRYPEAAASTEWQELDAKAVAGQRFSSRLNEYFHRLVGENDLVVMLGEDIEAPYGGAFKITRGLSERFPHRVRNTPISEAAIVGVGTGLAIEGRIPIVEIMFGDFLTLCLDQILNQACKFEFMYNGRLKVPLIVRTPMGGHRGYGPTHSQSIEKHFLGIPYLTVVALNYRLDPAIVYDGVLHDCQHPTLVIENKIDYTRRIPGDAPEGFQVHITQNPVPTLRISPLGIPADVTVACYGGTLSTVEEAVETAFHEHDIVCEVICPTLVHPTDVKAIAQSARKSGRLLTVQEGLGFASWDSEVIASLSSEGVKPAVARVSSRTFPPTCKKLEAAVLPQAEDVVSEVVRLMED